MFFPRYPFHHRSQSMQLHWWWMLYSNSYEHKGGWKPNKNSKPTEVFKRSTRKKFQLEHQTTLVGKNVPVVLGAILLLTVVTTCCVFPLIRVMINQATKVVGNFLIQIQSFAVLDSGYSTPLDDDVLSQYDPSLWHVGQFYNSRQRLLPLFVMLSSRKGGSVVSIWGRVLGYIVSLGASCPWVHEEDV